MPELSDAQLVNFANDYLRPLADELVKLDQMLPVIESVYNARNLGSVINSGGSSNLIADGSTIDGRTRRSGGDVYNLITLVQDLRAFITTGRRDVLMGWQVNGVK